MTRPIGAAIRHGALALGLVFATAAFGQAPAPRPAAAPPAKPLLYGPPITLDQAKLVMAAAEAEAKKRGVEETIAIVEPTGELVMFERPASAQYAAYEFAIGKARTSARYRRETKVLFDQLHGGDNAPLNYPDAFVGGAGGIPIVVGGRIIGAIGSTGGADQDVAAAGAAALK